MQTPVGPGGRRVRHPSGLPVIVEAKLWRNPEGRRKVIGQILDYAKELARGTYETFDAAVRRGGRGEEVSRQRVLADVFGLQKIHLRRPGYSTPSRKPATRRPFAANRRRRHPGRRGRNRGLSRRPRVAALHVRARRDGHFQPPDGGQLVQPRVLVQSTIVRRIVVDLRHDSIEATEGDAQSEDENRAVSPEVLADRERFQRFWSGFLAKLKLDDQSQPVRGPAKSQNQYFNMPKGADGWVSAYVAPSVNRAGVYLTFTKGPIGDRLYAALRDDKDEIERALGIPVEWESDGNKHWIVSAKNCDGNSSTITPKKSRQGWRITSTGT